MSTHPPDGSEGARPFPTLAVVLVAVAVVAVGVVLAVARGGDDGGDGPDGTDGTGGARASAPAFGPVEVEGDPLPELGDDGRDPARGAAAPVLRLEDPDGAAVSLGGGGEPSLVVFLAHWCPHCQAEVPLLVEMVEDGSFEGARLVGVLTGTNRQAPNYPPVAWLEREAWPGEVALDDEDQTAAAAHGLSGYPFLVVLDAEGRVVARASGEQPREAIEGMLQAAGASAGP